MFAWSNDGQDVDVGAVADWCRRCDRVRVFTIEEKLVRYDFLGIPVTPVHRAARRRICWECGEWHFVPFLSRYGEVVSIHEAERLPLRKLTRITNPSLFAELEDAERDRRG